MRLPRPHIPLEVRCRVVLRQLGEMFPEPLITITRNLSDPTVNPVYRRGFGRLLEEKLTELAELLGCTPADLRLDHDPALVNRLKLVRKPNGRTEHQVIVQPGCEVIRYFPDANDPEHLIYRVEAAHGTKTRVRGDNGQLSDLALMRKERKRVKKATKPKKVWPKGRRLQSRSSWPKKRWNG